MNLMVFELIVGADLKKQDERGPCIAPRSGDSGGELPNPSRCRPPSPSPALAVAGRARRKSARPLGWWRRGHLTGAACVHWIWAEAVHGGGRGSVRLPRTAAARLSPMGVACAAAQGGCSAAGTALRPGAVGLAWGGGRLGVRRSAAGVL
jgi:hypothetical protein